MVIKKVDLEIVCGVTSSMPDTKLPEVAFAGKSNVGKSSLINGLMNRKSYAKVSQKPGKTQTINYYNINDEVYIVDLPGYGFANVSPAVKASCVMSHLLMMYRCTTGSLKMVSIRQSLPPNWISSAGIRQLLLWHGSGRSCSWEKRLRSLHILLSPKQAGRMSGALLSSMCLQQKMRCRNDKQNDKQESVSGTDSGPTSCFFSKNA